MDRRERYYDAEEQVRIALDSLQARLWTALPGVIETFDPDKMTVSVQPTINGFLRQQDSTWKDVQMPLLTDCPVLWQGGGGATWVFPIAKGDECLVIFSARCIDAWWRSGFNAPTAGSKVNAFNDPPHPRMHSLSDGFALVGVRSQPRKFTVDANVARLRTDDDAAYLEFNPTAKSMNIVMPGGITLNGVTIDASGNLTSPATITGETDVIADGKSGKSHVHGGVQSGGSDTGPPG